MDRRVRDPVSCRCRLTCGSWFRLQKRRSIPEAARTCRNLKSRKYLFKLYELLINIQIQRFNENFIYDFNSIFIQVTLRRDGREETMHKDNIKVGDIIKIKNGMDIPVDGICVEASGVLADESSLTGESDHL